VAITIAALATEADYKKEEDLGKLEDQFESALPLHVGASMAAGESVINCPSLLNGLKDTYDHSCKAVIERAQMSIST
jgi:hypothetical protein